MTAPQQNRIAIHEDVANALAVHPEGLLLRILSLPYQKITEGMGRGLIFFERHHILERMRSRTEDLHRRGVSLRFGGAGEGTGNRGGLTYQFRTGETHALDLLGLVTTKNYPRNSVSVGPLKKGPGSFITEFVPVAAPEELLRTGTVPCGRTQPVRAAPVVGGRPL